LPWADWSKGKGLTERKLADILIGFGIKPKREWKPGTKTKVSGYAKKDLKPVFDRYIGTKPKKV
jgi:hypothetical protein